MNRKLIFAIIIIMISIKISDVSNFMQNLLVKDTFDSFLFCDGEIHTANTISINGRINRNFYTSEELELINEDFVSWKKLKHICFEAIKGKKVPTKMKLIFSLPKNAYPKIIEDSGVSLLSENIGGLYIHIIYENNEIEIITGTSLNIFTMDKVLDKFWDKTMHTFLSKHFDILEL